MKLATNAAGLSEQLKWKQEFEDLEVKGVETRHAQLQQARGGLDSLRAEVAALEGEANAFPTAARRSMEDVKKEIVDARKDLDDRDKELLEAR